LTRRTLITWGRFAIPEKLPFHEEEIAVIGKRVRREPLPGVDFRVPMRDGSRRERGEDSIRSGDLISTLFPPICFLHGRYYSRFHRGRSVIPPEPVDLLNTMIGRTEKNFIVSKGFPLTRHQPQMGLQWGTLFP